MKGFYLSDVVLMLLASCSKESKCVKGRIIGINSCSQTWGMQILEGPKIGTQSGIYDNVIELFDVPINSKSIDDIIYFTYTKKKAHTERPCNGPLLMVDYSSVEKSLVNLGDTECQ